MEENNIFEGTTNEAEIVAEVTGEEFIPANSEEFEVIETNESNGTSDLVGKLLFGAAAAAVGGGIAYYVKNKPRILTKKAEKMKARAEKKAAKSAAKIVKANAILEQYKTPEEIPEEVKAVTVTTTE